MDFYRKKLKSVLRGSKTVKDESADRKLSYQVTNFQHIGARANQEDSFAVINGLDVTKIARQGLFAAIADGMGGMAEGKAVSQHTISRMIEAFHGLNDDAGIGKQLSIATKQISDEIYQVFDGMGGSTLIAALIRNACLHWVSVGDSSLFLYRGERLIQINEEHTVQNEMLEDQLHQESIDKQEILEDPEGERLSQFIGKDVLDKTDYSQTPLKLRDKDVILLCSDGVSKFISENEISSILAQNISQIEHSFIQTVLEKSQRGQDNFTGIVIKCVY